MYNYSIVKQKLIAKHVFQVYLCTQSSIGYNIWRLKYSFRLELTYVNERVYFWGFRVFRVDYGYGNDKTKV
jgi:hypothetical protein